MSELKPCPFCGYLPTKHIVRNADGVDGWVVECLKCKGGVWFWRASIHEALAAWNTRDSRAEAVERVKELLKPNVDGTPVNLVRASDILAALKGGE